MARKETRAELLDFLETTLGGIDRAFCDFQLATHWLLYAASNVQKKEMKNYLRKAESFAERGLRQIRELASKNVGGSKA